MIRKQIPDLPDWWIERFWSKVKADDNGCWIWQGRKDKCGYGLTHFKRIVYRCHRIAFKLSCRDPKPELLVCHTCDVPACVNPDHLWEGTAKDNNDDKIRKGRRGLVYRGGAKNPRYGESHHSTKLKPSDIPIIRRLFASGATYPQVAKRFGVSENCVGAIKLGITWKHIR